MDVSDVSDIDEITCLPGFLDIFLFFIFVLLLIILLLLVAFISKHFVHFLAKAMFIDKTYRKSVFESRVSKEVKRRLFYTKKNEIKNCKSYSYLTGMQISIVRSKERTFPFSRDCFPCSNHFSLYI